MAHKRVNELSHKESVKKREYNNPKIIPTYRRQVHNNLSKTRIKLNPNMDDNSQAK